MAIWKARHWQSTALGLVLARDDIVKKSIATSLSKRKSVDRRNYGHTFLVSSPDPLGPRTVAGITRIKHMAFSLAPLLIHSESVPLKARQALLAASVGPSEQRKTALVSAARVLYIESSLDCRDALEIVGLQGDCGCG
jgi:hypothetical protein